MPDCIECGYIIPLPENIEVLEIIDQYVNFLYGTYGVPNINSIDKVLCYEGVSDRRDILQKIIIYVQAANQERYKKTEAAKIISSKSKTVV